MEQILFERLFVDKKTLRIIHELMPKAMYDPVFVERRRMMTEGGYQKMHDRFADPRSETISP